MKDIARVAIVPGMELAEDVYDYKNTLIYPAGTILQEEHIAKLTRYSIMVVNVKEDIDYATTHFEKVRLSQGFKTFVEIYKTNLNIYKSIMIQFIKDGIPFQIDQLLKIHNNITSHVKSREALLDYLYNMLPSEDDMTYAHCLNAALIAGVFADWIAVRSNEERELLILSGFLYDIGKYKLPYQLIWKPGKLTELEFTQIKTHTFIGFQLLNDIPELNPEIIKATLMHHERMDGSGYPSRLQGTQIPLIAQIISIVDSYEAMTSARTYRQSLHPFQVIENFERTGATSYNNMALQTILYHIASAQLGLTAKLSNDKEGEIILINKNCLSRPLLKLSDDVLDLYHHPELEIVSII